MVSCTCPLNHLYESFNTENTRTYLMPLVDQNTWFAEEQNLCTASLPIGRIFRHFHIQTDRSLAKWILLHAAVCKLPMQANFSVCSGGCWSLFLHLQSAVCHLDGIPLLLYCNRESNSMFSLLSRWWVSNLPFVFSVSIRSAAYCEEHRLRSLLQIFWTLEDVVLPIVQCSFLCLLQSSIDTDTFVGEPFQIALGSPWTRINQSTQ